MRRVIKGVAAAATVLIAGAAVPLQAQEWPSKPIRFVVPYSPGGSTDVSARAISEGLGQALHQPVVVENRVGATGAIGTSEVARAAPDGYTVLVTADLHTTIKLTQKNVAWDPVRDFVAVTQLATQPMVVAVHSSVPASTIGQLIELAKSKPGSLSYGTPGTGSTHHLAGELFKRMAGIDMTHIPYKGGGDAIRDLVGGQIPVGVLGAAPLAPHIKAGRVRLLAVTTAKRASGFPDVPTLAESGFAGFDVPGWLGVLVPVGTNPEVVARLHDEIVKVLASPKVQERFASFGLDVVGNSPKEFDAIVRNDVQRWGKLVSDLRLQLQ